MATKVTISAIQNEPKRPLMPHKLLKAAIHGNETELRKLLGLLKDEDDHPRHTKISVEDVTPMEPSACLQKATVFLKKLRVLNDDEKASDEDEKLMEPSDCLISITGMKNTILHILSANGHGNLVSTICMKDSSLLKAHNVRNETPFHHAARFGHINTFSELIQCAKSAFGEAGLKELLRKKNYLGETALHEAARRGHGAVVSTLMEGDLELAGLVNNDSVSPLYVATARGSLDMVQNMVAKMLNHQITPAFYSGPKELTALHAAVLLQNRELTQELLRLYSEPLGKKADETGRNPFHLVASTGNHEIAKLLLDKDPSLAYIQDSDGSFPVHTAAQMGHVKIIVLLLKRCLDSGDLLDGNGRNFLHIAIEAKKSDVLFKLLKDSKNNLPIPYWEIMFNRMANTMDNKGDTPLHLAAKHGYVTVMHSLLKNNTLDLTLQNKEGQTAFNLSVTGQPSERRLMPHQLLKAAMGGNETDLKELLGLNDDEEDHLDHMKLSVENVTPMLPSDCLRSITGMGDTIIHILSANGHGINLVATICTKDSSLLKAHNVRKETPFHHAARFGHANTILKLIQCAQSAFGEDGLTELLRQKNCLGETALHEAARHGHRAVVSTLMEEDPELAGLVNNDSVSPLYLATARGSLEMVKNMVAKMLNHDITPDFYSGPKKNTALHAAVLQDTELTKELLQLYSEPVDKWADETGRNPFHLVASTGNHYIAELLLDKDPSMAYIKDSDGSFPVHCAARMGHVKMIVLLLQRCLDSGDLLDGNGRNFLHIAIEGKKQSDIFRFLKDSKKELPISYWNKMLNTMDNKGNTPLHLVANHEYNYIMLSLLKNNELDLTLQNKQSLTAFDLSVIQFRKSSSNTQTRDYFCEFYLQKRGTRFSTGWFQHYTKDKMSEEELIRVTKEDDISTMAGGGSKMNSPESLMAKAQLVGLGSVLVTTVAFSAAFTLPGGTNQDTGAPILGMKTFIFNAFLCADFFAFIFSFLANMLLIYSSRVHNSVIMERCIHTSMNYFTIAAQSMAIALGLGLYLVLAPTGILGRAFLIWSVFLILSNNVLIFSIQYKHFWEQLKILKRIPDVASDVNPKDIRAIKGPRPYTIYIISAFYSIGPLIFIFVVGLLFSLLKDVKK